MRSFSSIILISLFLIILEMSNIETASLRYKREAPKKKIHASCVGGKEGVGMLVIPKLTCSDSNIPIGCSSTNTNGTNGFDGKLGCTGATMKIEGTVACKESRQVLQAAHVAPNSVSILYCKFSV